MCLRLKTQCIMYMYLLRKGERHLFTLHEFFEPVQGKVCFAVKLLQFINGALHGGFRDGQFVQLQSTLS